MDYLERTLGSALTRAAASFPVIMLTGPRQVGKTTLLEHYAAKERVYVTLDDADARALAQQDPALFLQSYQPPIVIDEVQYAPELFLAIKQFVDRTKQAGSVWLTGSQKFHLMQGLSETLAGRVAIFDLLGLSQAEMQKRAADSLPFLPTLEWLQHAKKAKVVPANVNAVYETIWLGSFPGVALSDGSIRDIFYRSYMQTYIQRDVRALARVGDEMAFTRFVRAAAARTAQVLNYADLARDVDVDVKTIKSWISILETSGIVYLLYPYHNNVTKRIIKSPKMYFLDTGLCAFLTQWSSARTLEAGAMSGAIFETFAIAEILKSYWHNGVAGNFFYYRDRDQYEVDLLIEQDGKMYPVEFKKSATPSFHAAKNFSHLVKLGCDIGSGAVVCLRESDVVLSRDIIAIPITYI